MESCRSSSLAASFLIWARRTLFSRSASVFLTLSSAYSSARSSFAEASLELWCWVARPLSRWRLFWNQFRTLLLGEVQLGERLALLLARVRLLVEGGLEERPLGLVEPPGLGFRADRGPGGVAAAAARGGRRRQALRQEGVKALAREHPVQLAGERPRPAVELPGLLLAVAGRRPLSSLPGGHVPAARRVSL